MTTPYLKSVSKIALLSVLGSIAFYPTLSYAQDKDLKYKPAVDFTYRPSTTRSIGEIDSLLPLAQQDNNLLLLDVRGRRAPHDKTSS